MRDWVNNGDSLQYDLLVSIGEKLREYSKQPVSLTRFFLTETLTIFDRFCSIARTRVNQGF